MTKIISASLLIVLLILAGLFSYFCAFEVPSGSLAFLQNKPAVTFSPGLNVKFPWDNVSTINVNPAPMTVTVPLSNGQDQLSFVVVTQIVTPVLYLQHLNEATPVSQEIIQNITTTVNAAPIAPSAAGLGALQNKVLSNLNQDTALSSRGVQIQAVWLSAVTASDAAATLIYQAMQGLAGQIAQGVVESGAAQATQIRATAEKGFLASQQQALDAASKMMGAGNRQAIQMLAPLYQSNPALFKAYVSAKAKRVASHS